MVVAGLSAATAGLVAGGALDTGRTYDLPVASVRERLAGLDVPEASLMTTGAMKPDVSRVVGDRSVRWQVREPDGVSVLYVAELEPLGQGQTRVRLSVKHQGASTYEKITSTKFMRGFNEASFAEALDARLEQNPERRLNPVNEWAMKAGNDPEQIQELGAVIGTMYSDVSKQMEDGGTFGFSSADGVHPRAPVEARMRAATRPSIDLSDYQTQGDRK